VRGGTVFSLEVQPPANGTITPEEIAADSTGTATAVFTAGTTAGQTARVVAVSDGVSGRTALFTFQPGPAGRITLETDPSNLQVGGESNLTATVKDSYGNPVSDTTRVVFSTNPQGGALTPSAIRTSRGVARSILSGVTQAGDVEVIAAAGDISGSARITFTVGDLTTIDVTAAPQSVLLGNSSTITATAVDRHGNPISGTTLSFQIVSNPGGNCRLQNSQRRTNAEGEASTIFTAGQTTGSAIITVWFDADGQGDIDEDDEVNGSVFVDISAGG